MVGHDGDNQELGPATLDWRGHRRCLTAAILPSHSNDDDNGAYKNGRHHDQHREQAQAQYDLPSTQVKQTNHSMYHLVSFLKFSPLVSVRAQL